MEKIVKTLIDNALEGVDVYFNNGSIWLIFTETKEWVLELEKNGHLWYNHYFFRNLFSYLSMDVVENQKYITKYVEDALQNGVKNTETGIGNWTLEVEDALQNGVKNTRRCSITIKSDVEDALKNGVKNTYPTYAESHVLVEDALKNGVKNTLATLKISCSFVEDALKNGVKNTTMTYNDKYFFVEDTLQNGVKNTGLLAKHYDASVEDALQNGLKSININTGIKEVKELPDMSGELRGYGDYYRKQKDRAKPHVLYVKDVIEKGLKLK